MKKTYTFAFKAQVVQELLKETKTITQLAAEHSVHLNLLRDWKFTALKGMAGLFEKGDSIEVLRTAYDHQIEDRYAQIGCLIIPYTWQNNTGDPWSRNYSNHAECVWSSVTNVLREATD